MDDQQIAWLGQRLDLPREDLFEAEVVSRGREKRCVGGEGHGRIGAPVLHVPHDVLGRQMLRIGGASTVAAEEQGASPPNSLANECQRPIEIGGRGLRRAERNGGKLAQGVRRRRHQWPSTSCLSRASIPRSTTGSEATGSGGRPSSIRRALPRVSRSACSSAPISSSHCRAPASERLSPWLSLAMQSTKPSASSARASFDELGPPSSIDASIWIAAPASRQTRTMSGVHPQ